MAPEKDFTKEWLKGVLTQTPPASLDQDILNMAQRRMAKSERSNKKNAFHFLGLTASVFIIMLTVTHFSPVEKRKSALSEPVEMITYYNNIELMSDAAVLSDNDWQKIEGNADEI